MDKNLANLRRIDCPNCGKQLNVPVELLRKKLACPRCSHRFHFEPDDEGDLAKLVVAAPADPNLFPPGAAPPERGGRSARKRDANADPPTGQQRGDVDEPQTARFIEPDANATRVKLGADGRLPDLALAAEEKQVDVAEAADSSNPWLLIGVLSISLLFSVLLLVVEPPAADRRPAKMEARQQLELIFNQWDKHDPAARDIHDLLARALQAYNRGDLSQEAQEYRRILNLLNREDAPKYGGYSGDDNRLKELLGEMLR